MRPVNKWPVGTVHGLHTIQLIYNPWSSAKPYLEANLGAYCSYCETRIFDEGMHVEHVKPKSKFKSLKYSWVNFLVSCQRCNGPDNKGEKKVVFNNIHLPHRNNTYKSISYYSNGSVTVTPGLSAAETAKAQALINLVGLDKMLGHPNYHVGDKRYERRSESWHLANRYKTDYETPNTNLTPRFIAEFAAQNGFWSVWMKVFENHNDVLNELIISFKGTFANCRTTDVNRR